MDLKLSKTDFCLALKISFEVPWLQFYQDPVSELIAFCENREERAIVYDLLKRFTFIDYGEQASHCGVIVKKIVQEWNLPEEETQIVAITKDSDPDSAQLVLQMLKGPFARYGWNEVKMVNRFGKAISNLRKYPKIILIDEFIGSGATVLSRIEELRKEYNRLVSEGLNPTNFEIKVCVVACMENVKSWVESKGVEIHSELWLKKGITQHYTGKALRKACKRMLKMESRLYWDDNDKEFPFGYQRSESLFAIRSGNASNNLFPIFWWVRLRNGDFRKPVFLRKEHSKRWSN